MNLSFEVRNARTGRLVRTCGDAQMAIDWAKAHSHALGELQAWAVERIIRERLLTDEPETGTVRNLRPRRRAF